MDKKANQSGERGYRVVQVEGKITWNIEELWDGGVVRGPYGTRDLAIQNEEKIAKAEGFIDDLVLKEAIGEEKSRCDAFEKDSAGNWRCIEAIDFEIANRTIVIGQGITFTRGVPFMGFDIAQWLDDNCS
jgi:hypothetical protein